MSARSTSQNAADFATDPAADSAANRNKSIGRKTAFAVGVGLGSAAVAATTFSGLMAWQAKQARRRIGNPQDEDGHTTCGSYGSGPGLPIHMAVLGDSLAVGLGAEEPNQTVAAVIAAGVAAFSGRRVALRNVAVVGSESLGLPDQMARLRDFAEPVDVAIILVGGNDVTHLIPQKVSAKYLAETVAELRDMGAEVVTGTCPDLGTLRPVPQPLRTIARHRSRQLAAVQTVAAVEAGGITVSLGDLLGREFEAMPHDLFSHDQFHPSAAGYARCGSAMLPTVCSALGVWPESMSVPAARDSMMPVVESREVPVADAAVDAAQAPGTEVSSAPTQARQRLGRLVQLRRRVLRT